MIIPISELDPLTLENIAESFVLREGTDYGLADFSLQEKVDHVLNQLRSGEAVLVYSEEYESVDIRLATTLSESDSI